MVEDEEWFGYDSSVVRASLLGTVRGLLGNGTEPDIEAANQAGHMLYCLALVAALGITPDVITLAEADSEAMRTMVELLEDA